MPAIVGLDGFSPESLNENSSPAAQADAHEPEHLVEERMLDESCFRFDQAPEPDRAAVASGIAKQKPAPARHPTEPVCFDMNSELFHKADFKVQREDPAPSVPKTPKFVAESRHGQALAPRAAAAKAAPKVTFDAHSLASRNHVSSKSSDETSEYANTKLAFDYIQEDLELLSEEPR